MSRSAEPEIDPFAEEDVDARQSQPNEPSPASEKRRGWRRFAQVNLLMVLVALGLLSGYFALRRNFLVPYLEQREAREALSNKGAQFSSVPASPKWAQALFRISDDDFQNVEMIKLEHREVKDADLVALHKFPHLRRLYLASTPITDDGLKHLHYCTRLRRISLWDTQVGDAGIRELETLKDLRIIDIHRTWTTDAALETLGTLPALEELVLDDSTTSRGVGRLSGLKNLRRLSLRNTFLKSDCLESLRDCPIAILEMPYEFVDRESAENLRFVPRVRDLDLRLDGATDDDLHWLGAMTHLRSLSLSNLEAEGRFARHVAGMRRLQTLSIDSDRLRAEHLPTLLSAPDLRQANLTANVTREDLRTLNDNGLETMQIASPWLGGAVWDGSRFAFPQRGRAYTPQPAFYEREATEYADYERRFMTVDDLAPLLAQTNLRSLHLGSWTFAPGALASLSRLEKLEDVHLLACRFDVEELVQLATKTGLKELVVEDWQIQDEYVSQLADAPELTKLALTATDATHATASKLARNRELTWLRLNSTALDEEFLDDLESIVAERIEELPEGDARNHPFELVFGSPAFSPERFRSVIERFRTTVEVGATTPPDSPPDFVISPDSGTNFVPEVLRNQSFGSRVASPTPDGPYARSSLPDDFEADFVPGENSPMNAWAPGIYFLYPVRPIMLDVDKSFLQYVTSSRRDPTPRSTNDSLGPPIPKLEFPLASFFERGGFSVNADLVAAEGLANLLSHAPTRAMSLFGGKFPAEGIDALARWHGNYVVLQSRFEYDVELMRTLASTPGLNMVAFNACRKPTVEELRTLTESNSVQSVNLEHSGEPYYFEELSQIAEASGTSFFGKVVYDPQGLDAGRPQRAIVANVGAEDLDRLLELERENYRFQLYRSGSNYYRYRNRLVAHMMRLEEAAAAAE